ncbi:hypothetical protein V502_03343, partial [Pseudogymnoascus sp. VKM F-4520 (FW-2644)]
MGAFGSEASG